MKKIFVSLAIVLGIALPVQAQPAPTKVATIQVQTAILTTKDGQKAAGELQTKFAPRKGEFEKKQADIANMQDTLKKGQATMSEESRTKLMRDIDSANTKLQRETQDAQADLDEEQQKVMQELGNKMMAIIDKYAQQNGIAVVIDVSNPQTPVIWAAQAIDITPEIIKLYDQAHPTVVPSGPAGAAPAGAAPKPGLASPPPAVPPATKKK